MPTYPIQLKRNGTAAATPSSLLHGEVALNYADGKIFWKDASNVIQSFTFQAYALASHTHAASDITSGTFDAARIANDSITYAKIQNVSATDRLLGRSSAGAGDVEEITCTAFGRSLIDDADAAAARTTLSVQPTASPAFTGAATFANTGNVVPLTVTNTGTANSLVVATNFIVDGSGRLGLFGAPRAFEACAVLGTAPSSSQASLGFRVQCTYPSSTTTDAASFSSFPTTQAASYTLTNLYHFAAFQQAFGAGSTVTNQYGLFVDSTLTGATNNYAVYTGIASGTGRWAIYAAGTAASYFGGQVQISAGSASACGVAFSGDTNTGLAQIGGADTASLVTAGVERVRVDASGNVGIGKSPSYRLDVLGDLGIDSAGNAVLRYGRNNSYKWAIYNDTSDNFIFYSDAAFAERLRISSTGEVIVGTTDQGAYNLQCNGTGVWGAGAYVNGSDERIKDEIAPIDEATSVITAMQPVTFRYKPTWSSDQSIQPGFIAQQLQEALAGTPYLDGVVQQGTEYLSVAYQSLIPLLVKALQESNARIAALEERNHA